MRIISFFLTSLRLRCQLISKHVRAAGHNPLSAGKLAFDLNRQILTAVSERNAVFTGFDNYVDILANPAAFYRIITVAGEFADLPGSLLLLL